MLDSSVWCLTVRGAVCLKVTTLCFLGVALLTGYPLPCLPNSLCVEQDEKVWLPWSYREVLKQAAALQITDPAFPVNSREGRPMTEPETQYQRYLARKRQKQEKKTQVSAFWTVVLWLDDAETLWSWRID